MIAYTIVTNNYLAYAKSLQESFLKYNPNDLFFIGLLDKPLENENLKNVVLVSDLNISYFEEMHQKYDAFELSCAMKPFFAEYFLKQKNTELIIYLDSDILIYDNFDFLKNLKNEHTIFLTSHILQHQKNPATQKGNLVSGIYNAGFFALSNSQESFLFLDWWKAKLKEYCYNDVQMGMFVDQIWLNHVHIFFENVCIIKNEGYNVAYWNIEERNISIENNIFKINENYKLIFFHFSGYELNNKTHLSKHGNPSLNFENYPQAKPLFEQYNQNLKKHHHDFYKNIKSAFGTSHLSFTQIEFNKIEKERTLAFDKHLNKCLNDEKKRWELEKIQADQEKKIAEEQAYLAKKKKSYFSVLWKALKGEIELREN